MAKIPATTFKDWKDGDVVTATDYVQELEIIRAAVNSTDDDVVILKNASAGTIKRVPSGTAFPSSPEVGDVFYRTDQDVLYVLGSDSQWKAQNVKATLDAHIANTSNPHGVTASQVGAVSKTGDSMTGSLNVTGKVTATDVVEGWMFKEKSSGLLIGKDPGGGAGYSTNRHVFPVYPEGNQSDTDYLIFERGVGAYVLRNGATRFVFASNGAEARVESWNGGPANFVAATINSSSDRDLKKNIEPYSKSALDEIGTTTIYSYNFKEEIDGVDLPHVGIIMQESPLDVVNTRGHGVDLYAMVAMSWKAIQELSAKNKDLENRLAVLEGR